MTINRIIVRIIGFPFFLIISIYYASVFLFRDVWRYILYGGELFKYTQKDQQKTIADLYDKLTEIQNRI